MQTMDDQPIESSFFGEGKWLTEFITVDNLEVVALYEEITKGLNYADEKVEACQKWVGSLEYQKFLQGVLTINGRVSRQNDLWCDPSTVIRIGVGNCANKSFLLTSLLRNTLTSDQVFCVLGNLHNGTVGGHAWVQVKLGGRTYVVESTTDSVEPLVPVESAARYEEIHLFNDQKLFTIADRVVLHPYTACFSPWLKDYLDWAYIEGRK